MGENHDTFFARVAPLFAPSVVRKIELAYILAKHAHRAQTREEFDERGERVRYFEHPRRAALIGIELARIARADTICASLLHDVLEDTRLSAELIEDSFGADVCGVIRVLSKVPKEGYLDRFYLSTDWRPYFVKACDRLDNLRALPHATVDFRKKQVAETRAHYLPLFERMVTLTPAEHRAGAALLRDEIARALDAVPLGDALATT